MNAITYIKDEYNRIRKISARHFILAVSAAMILTCLAVLRLPLDPARLNIVKWILLFLPALLILFVFYAAVNNQRRSVLWFTKWVYYLCAPILLLVIDDLVFDPEKKVLYSENFFGSFLPMWIAVWLIGAILIKTLARTIEFLLRKLLEKSDFAKRISYALATMYTPQKVISREKREGKAKWIAVSICTLFAAVAVFIFTVTMFLHAVYSNMEFEAILFTVTFAAGGLALEDMISGTALFVFFAIVTGYICYHMLKIFKNNRLVVADIGRNGRYMLELNTRKRVFHCILSFALLCGSAALFSSQTNFTHYVKMKTKVSTIYDDYYVEPVESIMTFPEKKRNLIYIYVESMENTYASKEAGGAMDKNYISELTKLTLNSDSVSFSNRELLGGASVFVPAITYTMGSTVAQTSGIVTNTEIFPLNSPKEFPAVTRLEDILHDNGYNQIYIEGSKGEFSMYDKYVGRYNDSIIYDRVALAEQGYSDEDADYIWKWGIEDRKLFEITKELITEVSQEDKPFFVTMYTMDTHTFETGHRCPDCDDSIVNDYLATVDCTSRQTAEFVEWVKQQPFYEDTTIILVGDHLGNKKTIKVDFDDEYIRTTYNCFINPAKEAVNTKNRTFSSLDMFPSTLSALGVEIKGDRLGLGTDLFSATQTLCEEFGEEEYKVQLERAYDGVR